MSALNYTHTIGWIFMKQQQFPGEQVAQLRHIIRIPSQPVFDLIPYNYALFGEVAYTNVIAFWFDSTISCLSNYPARQFLTNHKITKYEHK